MARRRKRKATGRTVLDREPVEEVSPIHFGIPRWGSCVTCRLPGLAYPDQFASQTALCGFCGGRIAKVSVPQTDLARQAASVIDAPHRRDNLLSDHGQKPEPVIGCTECGIVNPTAGKCFACGAALVVSVATPVKVPELPARPVFSPGAGQMRRGRYKIPSGVSCFVRPTDGGLWVRHTTTETTDFTSYIPVYSGGYWQFEKDGWLIQVVPNNVTWR